MSRDLLISEKFVLFVDKLPLLRILKSTILCFFFFIFPNVHIAVKHCDNTFLINFSPEVSSTASIVYTYLQSSHEGGLLDFCIIIHDLSHSSCINSTLPEQLQNDASGFSSESPSKHIRQKVEEFESIFNLPAKNLRKLSQLFITIRILSSSVRFSISI